MTDKSDWLAGLQVGDPVRMRFNTSKANQATMRRVARFTKTRIVLDNDSWVQRMDGCTPSACGCHWWLIEKPTAAQARKAKAGKAGR